MSNDDPSSHPGHAVGSALRKVIASAVLYNDQVAGKVDMRHSDMQTVHLLQLHGPMPAGRLAALTGLTTGSITAIVDRLERAGLVVREADPGDRRRVIVRPELDRIQALLAPHYEKQAERTARVISGYSDEELRTIESFLTQLHEAQHSSE